MMLLSPRRPVSKGVSKALSLAGALAFGLALLAPPAPARAATVDYSLVLPAAATANPLAAATAGAGVALAENVTGTIVGVRRSPWGASNSTLDLADAGSVYSALYNAAGKTGVSARYDFGGIFDRLSLVWGTPGPTNTLKLLLGGVEQFAMTGAGPLPLSGGGLKSVLVTISGLQFDTMLIGADHRALEFASLSVEAAPSPVPVPAAGLLLAAALGGLAFTRRRKAA